MKMKRELNAILLVFIVCCFLTVSNMFNHFKMCEVALLFY